MEDLKIHKTPKTPEIDFNLSTGVFLISGVSVPENSIEFYMPVVKWLKEYAKQPLSKTIINFKLSYINTSSLQFLYDILHELDSILEPPLVVVNWYYLAEDVDMQQMGEDFRDAMDMKFSFFDIEIVE